MKININPTTQEITFRGMPDEMIDLLLSDKLFSSQMALDDSFSPLKEKYEQRAQERQRQVEIIMNSLEES